MDIRYKRELNKNYLIIGGVSESQEDSYQIKMLEANQIKGFLKFYPKISDGKMEYFYEISSRQPLSRILEVRSITAREIELLLRGISQALEKAEEFLLEEKQILLEPEYIYVSAQSFTVYFCIVPGLPGNFPEALRKLFQYLLNKVDYKERDSVALVYQLYQECLVENYCIQDLLDVFNRAPAPAAVREPEPEAAADDGFSEVRIPLSRRLKELFTWKREDEAPGYPIRELAVLRESGSYHYEQKMDFEAADGETVMLSPAAPEGGVRAVLKSSLPSVYEDIRISSFPFILGKNANGVDYILESPSVSRFHLRIDQKNDVLYVMDLNSKNGTQVNGQLLEANEKRRLEPGDRILIAGIEFVLYILG